MLFFDSWSFGVVLWEMATLGKWIILRFILIILNLKLIEKWTKIFHVCNSYTIKMKIRNSGEAMYDQLAKDFTAKFDHYIF